MQPAGLPLPAASTANVVPLPVRGTPRTLSLGGVLPIGNQAEALRQQAVERPGAKFAMEQAQPAIVGLAGHIRKFFTQAQAARQSVEQEMIEALMARRGQYTAAKLQQIQEQRQPAIYMMVAASKMRQIEALVRDVLLGSGTEKPWTAGPTPAPEVPQSIVAEIVQQLSAEIEQAVASGFPPSMEAARQRAREMREEVDATVMEGARAMAERAERKMEDQQVEGGLLMALDAFVTDLATFKTAFIAGPIIRNKPKLVWGQDETPTVETTHCMEWERVDPFDMYPASWATNLQRGPLVRKHHLAREDLAEMIGVEGFSETAVREVLTRYGDTGHQETLSVETQKAHAEGKTVVAGSESGLIDALQYWGSASGKMLRQWGLTAQEVPDETKQYQIEAWLVGEVVIKAMLNADPLARRPFYGTSFQLVPGSVWGNSPYDLSRDCQDMCNAAARALAANVAISSGPQVGVLSNRIPAGDDITEMFPWKIWQFESDPMGSTAAPITFFQPSSNANELMTVFERFSLLADEYTGVPRYMAGFNGGEGGAGRTASGMSMMIGNASKTIKQLLGSIDVHVLTPLVERQYYHNRRYGEDVDFKGDIAIMARGALSLQTKEAAQVRNNEFLQIALNSPVAQQIMGIEGVAEVLRGTVKGLDRNPHKIVPTEAVLKKRMAEMQMGQMAQAAQGAQGAPGAPPAEQLTNGAPTSDHFSPQGA